MATTKKTVSAVEALILAITPIASEMMTNELACGLAEAQAVKLLKAWKDPTFDEWESVRKAFVAQKPAAMASRAADMAWSRLIKSAGLAKPKSTSAEAIQREEARKKEAERLAALSDDQIQRHIDVYSELSDDAGAKKYKAEKKRRDDEKAKPQKDAIDKAIKSIREKVKDCKDTKKLNAILKLLEA